MSAPGGDGTTRDEDFDLWDLPADTADVAAAGRSCLVILVLGAVLVLVLCVAIAMRWATT